MAVLTDKTHEIAGRVRAALGEIEKEYGIHIDKVTRSLPEEVAGHLDDGYEWDGIWVREGGIETYVSWAQPEDEE